MAIFFVATSGFGLFEIKAGEDTAQVVDGFSPGGDGRYYQNIFIDARNRFWTVSSDNAIACFDMSGNPLLGHKSELGIVEQFTEDGKDNLYIVFQKGIMRYDGRWLSNVDAGGDFIFRCATRHGGDMLFGTVGKGVLRMTSDGRFSNFTDDTQSAMANAKVGVIMEDATKNLWVGCTESGLAFIPYRKPLFEERTFSSAGVKSRGVLSSVTKGHDG